jgi:6-phosphogluconolactonase
MGEKVQTSGAGYGNFVMRIGNSDIVVVRDSVELSYKAAELLVRCISETLSRKERFSMALSGGSTPQALFSLLVEDDYFKNTIPWEKIHFFWGDERHVPPQDEQSNYRMANDIMLAKAHVQTENIHRMPTEQADAGKVAKDYEQELRHFFELATDELPVFDFNLLGIGPDGHTASLFPETEALHENRRLVVANWVEKFQTHRITMTAPVLNNADTIVFLVSGKEKAEVLQKVLEGDHQPDLLPAQLIQPIRGRLIWLVDQVAASRLT